MHHTVVEHTVSPHRLMKVSWTF